MFHSNNPSSGDINLSNLSCFLCFLIQEYHQSVSNSLDPDQARHFVGPDLGPNCLQMLSADDTFR